eukprot:scaffold224_cov276-Chaetoceros_neogracile.AAC.69
MAIFGYFWRIRAPAVKIRAPVVKSRAPALKSRAPAVIDSAFTADFTVALKNYRGLYRRSKRGCVLVPRSVQNAYIDSAFTADFTVAHPGNAAFHPRERGF